MSAGAAENNAGPDSGGARGVRERNSAKKAYLHWQSAEAQLWHTYRRGDTAAVNLRRNTNIALAPADHPGDSVRVVLWPPHRPRPHRQLQLHDLGSPQVFQTEETYRNAPLIDYQYPHDLVMGLGGDYQRTTRGTTLVLGGDIVGSPTLGPPVFMHRASAIENPQAPLSHHHIDSSHITPGVVRGGVGSKGWMVEGSWFHGQEPDENRTDFDAGARLHGRRARDRVAGAFGQKREVHGHFEAYLFEATWRATQLNVFYTRIESVAKDVLDVGFHPTVFHQHRQSQVAAFTGGYLRNVLTTTVGSLGIGGDITAYGVPANLRESYGSPLSFHLFLRCRAPVRGQSAHVH
jgi:hypothetical protein